MEHATLIRLLTVRVHAIEAARTQSDNPYGGAGGGDPRQPFLPSMRLGAETFVPRDNAGAFDPTRPLLVRQIGMLTGDRYGERPLYDDKAAERSEL